MSASHTHRRNISRSSTLCIPLPAASTNVDPHAVALDPQTLQHCEIEFHSEDEITPARLRAARQSYALKGTNFTLTRGEEEELRRQQGALRKTLFGKGVIEEQMKQAVLEEELGVDSLDELPKKKSAEDKAKAAAMLKLGMDDNLNEQQQQTASAAPQDATVPERPTLLAVKAEMLNAKMRSRMDAANDGVLGVQGHSRKLQRYNSMKGNKFMMYNMRLKIHDARIFEQEEKSEMDLEDISYVRKPDLARIIEEYEAIQNHPKYTLKQVVLSRRFHLYANRFVNSQYRNTLLYPTLKQPRELLDPTWICKECIPEPDRIITEKTKTRKGHRFIITADTQYGILMDGFAMDYPNWSQEIEISRKCVSQINAMKGPDRPLFVIVCGDLVDTESSFSGAIASWKKVMRGWERNLVFDQQVRDFKRVWAGLDSDIALVCLCGNHDVGNRPTRESIKHWTSAFGDDYLSFWVNGTYNICLNNCLFSNPAGAQDLFQEELKWMEERLIYANANNATHIFIYGHFPWFLKHEEESDDFLTSYSNAPEGWGPAGSRFADGYFTIPYEHRKLAMALFRTHNVTACFSGHFHQNAVAETSWGMPMIVTGPLSMNLYSEISHEFSKGEKNGIGMRIVDVGEKGEFTHKFILLDDEEELYKNAMKRCVRGMLHEEREDDLDKESSSQSLTQSESLAEIKMTVEEFEQFHTSYAFSTDNLAALDG